MAAYDADIYEEHHRSNWVRLRTLVMLRWFAIAGQISAIVVATRVYDVQIEVGPAAMIIGSSVLANLFSSFLYPENKRLSEREAAVMLVFDIVQLGLLLYLTGGLNNPFALLILAPVTIAAAVLQLPSMLMVAAVALLMICLISLSSIPLILSDGAILQLPPLFQFGFLAALVIGVVFLAVYARQVTTEMHRMREALVATQLALAREQKLTDLGGVVAAAAHELGTPLATIKLVSSELSEDLSDRPDLREDIDLLRQQADRCREILHSMGRAGKDDLHMRSAPLEAVVREAAEPHMSRGRTVLLDAAPDEEKDSPQPIILRRPEIIHGLRNLIQNAVDFSSERVEIDLTWGPQEFSVRISDDGPGFPSSVIGRIGDPFVRRRRLRLDTQRRPGYDGMGLGLFIAKTLLERSGARLFFANGRRYGETGWAGQATGGAIVTVVWPRSANEAVAPDRHRALGKNQPITS